MRGKRCSDDLFEVVCKTYDDTRSKRKTAKILKLDERTVRDLLERRISGTNKQRKRKLGRPNLQLSRSFKSVVKLHRFETNAALGDRLGLSEDQVQRRLPLADLKQHPAHIDKLTSAEKRNRIAWCRAQRNTDFSTWIFSDECAFELSDCSAPRRPLVHRSKHEKYAPCCVIQKATKSRQTLMIWGCVTATGLSRFAFVSGTMDEQQYVQILEDNLLDLLDDLPLSIRSAAVFQQDNARVHTTVRVAAFFGENDIAVANWSPYSPDLSVIENIWKLLKTEVRKLRPATLAELRAAIESCWSKVVTQKRCSALFQTMQRKMQSVKAKRGML